MAAQQRPLSPHLQVYKPQITSMLSILNRATGVVLAFAGFVLTAWLLAVASGSEAFASFNALAGSWVGAIAFVAVLGSLVFHSVNGIRHLLWDIGWGFELPKVEATGWAVVVLTVVITAALAYLGFSAGGAA